MLMRPTTSPPTRTALALAAAVLLASACGGGDPAEEPATPTGSPTAEATADAPADATDDATATEASGDVTVTILTHDSFNVSDDVLAAFEERAGIDVEILPGGDAGSMVNQAILTAGDPQGDVLFGVDNTFLSRALDADLFVPYESPGLEAVDERYILDDEHRVTPIDVGDVCL
ncbi:MAG: hypothetical protein KY457_11205, partial [Actinobacteria bacterium]|nr:hypothetical protein [Actinomycetota bacterium]